MSLYEKIEDFLKKTNRTKAELANALKISPQRLNNWLKRKSIPTEYLTDIAKFFDVDVDYLLSNIVFLKREHILKEFAEIIEKYIRENVNVRYKYFHESLKPFDDEDLYPVDIALSNDNKNFITIHIISSSNKINEATISMMYYRYETNATLYNVSIFDELPKYVKSNKIKRVFALTDKVLDSFGNFEKKILLKEIENNL